MYRGLGIERIFTAFLKIYCDPGSLVLVLNTSTVEEVSDWYITFNYYPVLIIRPRLCLRLGINIANIL